MKSNVITRSRLDMVSEYNEVMDVAKWRNEIPYLTFKSDWKVKILPPFNGAVVRYAVRRGNVLISVYLDCYRMLGSLEVPYWEIYNRVDDPERFEMDDTDGMMKYINDSIERLDHQDIIEVE